jgi:ketosteroid isomerase-like protein
MTTQDQHAEAIAWLKDYHRHTDALDSNLAVPKFYTDDCVMTFAANPAITGKSSIIDFFDSQFPFLESMKHTIKHVDVLPDRIYQEADIRYVVKGDPERKEILLPGMAVFGRKPGDEKMSFFTVYLDPTELKERIMAVAAGSL